MKIVLAIHDSACSRATLVSLAERPWPTATEIVVLSVVPVMPGVFLAADWHAGDLIASIEAQKILFDTHKQLVADCYMVEEEVASVPCLRKYSGRRRA